MRPGNGLGFKTLFVSYGLPLPCVTKHSLQCDVLKILKGKDQVFPH